MIRKLYILLTIFVVANPGVVKGQIITTIAGTGVFGCTGDGGPVSAAPVFHPRKVVSDAVGNIFFVDDGCNCVRKINLAGIITTVAGTSGSTVGFSGDGGLATAALLDQPLGICFDRPGNLYIADQINDCIRKVNTSGIITTIAGVHGVSGYNGDGIVATTAQLNRPTAVVADTFGNIYIGDNSNNRVRKIDTFGIITTVAGTGVAGYTGDGGAATMAKMASAYDIEFDRLGNLYIADDVYNTVRKVDLTGTITTVAGNGLGGDTGDGGPATMAKLRLANIGVDSIGNLYIDEVANYRIRRVNPAGIIDSFAGTGMPGYSGDYCDPKDAQFNGQYVSVDRFGRIFICEISNHRIRMISDDHAPVFVGGHSQNASFCMDSATSYSMDTLLAAMDPDPNQTVTWNLIGAPLHGTIGTSYSTVTTGSLLYPSGFIYTPTAVYHGNDSFRVVATDCSNVSDTTNIVLRVDTFPDAGVITGPISFVGGCDSAILANTTPGGIWSSSNISVATITGSGVVYGGGMAGMDTISYTVSNSCGISITAYPITVTRCEAKVPGNSKPPLVTMCITPNPNYGTFTITGSLPTTKDVTIEVMDILGKTVYNTAATVNNGTINKAIVIDKRIENGVYLVKMRNDEMSAVVRFTLER